MRYIVDRIVSGIAVCENAETGETVKIPAELIPFTLNEGDIFTVENGEMRQLPAEAPVDFDIFG